ERGWRDAERETHEPGEPLVKLVFLRLELGKIKFLQLGRENQLGAVRLIPRVLGIKHVLKLPDLVSGPGIANLRDPQRDRALGEEVQLAELLPDPDVDGGENLLDRRVAVNSVRPH